MALPRDKITQDTEHEYWRKIRDERGDTEFLSLYGEAFPEESQYYTDILRKHGPTNAADVLLGTLVVPGKPPLAKGTKVIEPAPTIEPTPLPKKLLEPTAPTLPEEELLPTGEFSAKVMERFARGEIDTEAKIPFTTKTIVDTIKRETKLFGRQLEEEYVIPYLEAKKFIIDRPLQKLQDVERAAIRKGIAKMRRHTVYLPTVEESKEFINAGNWRRVNELMEQGRFPTADELGEEFIGETIAKIGQEKTGAQSRATIKLFSRAVNDPESSWLRSGEVKSLVSPEFIAKHGKLKSLAPLILTAPGEIAVGIATTPTEWDNLIAYYFAGRAVIQPATKAGFQWLATKGWATKPLTPLKAIGRKFPKKAPVSVQNIQSILRADPDVSDDILRAFTQLSNAEKADIARAVKLGKPVHLATPRFKGGAPAFGQPAVQRIEFPGAPAAREFFPPVPVRGAAVPPTEIPSAAPEFGVQQNLPAVFEGIPTRAAEVPLTDIAVAGLAPAPAEPLALPEAGRAALPPIIDALRRPPVEPRPFYAPVPIPDPRAIPLAQRTFQTAGLLGTGRPAIERGVPQLPAPGEPTNLRVVLKDTALQVNVGLTPELVDILRAKGMTDQQIVDFVSPEFLLPEGAKLATAVSQPEGTAIAPSEATQRLNLQDLPERPWELILDQIERNEGADSRALVETLWDKGIHTIEGHATPDSISVTILGDDLPDALLKIAKKPETPFNYFFETAPEELVSKHHIDIPRERLSEAITVLQDSDFGLRPVTETTTPEQWMQELEDFGLVPSATDLAIPLPEQAPPLEPVAEPTPVPTQMKPVTILKEGKTAPAKPPKKVVAKKGKISVLPDKDRVLSELDTAIKNAPDVEIEYPEGTKFETKDGQRIADKPPLTEKISVKMDGGTIQVFNIKTALSNVRKLVSGIPKTMVREQPLVRITKPRPIAATTERLGGLIKGAPEGYFTDGSLIVKGTPPKGAKIEDPNVAGMEINDPDLILDMLNRRTDPAELQYYISISNNDMGVSDVPIANLDPNKNATPRAIFKFGNRYAAFDQYRLNMIRKRFPDATYGLREDGMLIAYDNTGPVAGLMAFPIETEPIMDYPPGLAEAAKAGIVELPPTPPLAGEISPIVEAHTDNERLTQLLQQRGTLPDDELARSIGRVVDKETEMANLVKLHGADPVLDEIQRQAGEPEPPTKPLDDWRKTESADLRDRLEEEGELGAILPRRADEPPLPEDPDIQAALDVGKKKSGHVKQMADWVKDKTIVAKDLATAEFEPALRRAGHVQFVDDLRTGYIPIMSRARQQWLSDKGIIYGTITRKEKDSLMALLALRDMENDLLAGLALPDNLHEKFVTLPSGDIVPSVFVERVRLERELAAKNPEVIAAAERYRDYSRLVGEDLVAKGKLKLDTLREDYFPHMVVDYLPDWWDMAPFAARLAQDPFRRYVIPRKGTIKGIVYDERALDVHYTSVLADNAMEDWGKSQMEKWDLLSQIPPDQKKIVLRGASTARHRQPYEYNGKKYMGIRFANTTARWGHEANLDLLEQALDNAAIDGERLLALPADRQSDVLRSYLEDVGPQGGNAIRRALILGRFVKTYVVPKEIGDKLLNLRDYYGTRWLRPLVRATTLWKATTLSPFGAGMPFIINQILGDGLNTFRTSPGAITKIPQAVRILLNIDPTKEGQLAKIFPKLIGNLSPAEQEARRIILEKDVLGSGFFREFSVVDKLFDESVGGRAATTILKSWTRGNNFREAVLRAAMAYHQSVRVAKGKGLHAPEYQDILASLDTDSGIGYISRNSNVDYLAIPKYYQNFIRGIAFPFATFWQKSATNWAKYVKNAPFRFTGRFVVPYVAADTYNHIRFPDLEAMGPEWFTGRFHIWLGRFDDDGDGFKERARGWGPQQPLDMAIQWTGLHLLSSHVAKLRAGVYESPREAAIEQLRDMGIIPSLEATAIKQAEQLLNPMIQVIEGIARNQDPFTRQKIVPDQLSGISPEQKFFSYYAPYALEKLATPVGVYMRETRGDEKIFGPVPRLEDLPSGISRYAHKGPLAVGRGFGIYDFDVRQLFARQVIKDPVRNAEALGDRHLYKIQEDYIAFGGTVSEYLASDRKRQLVSKANKDGIFFVNDDYPDQESYLDVRLNLFWVQQRRFDRLEGLATTDEERQQYKNALFQVSYQQALEIMNRLDQKAWPAWVKRMAALGKKHPWAQPKEQK